MHYGYGVRANQKNPGVSDGDGMRRTRRNDGATSDGYDEIRPERGISERVYMYMCICMNMCTCLYVFLFGAFGGSFCVCRDAFVVFFV